jgi:hypothetical protein
MRNNPKKLLKFKLNDGSGTVALRIIKELPYGFYLTQTGKTHAKRDVQGPYQITHASGARLTFSDNPEALEDFTVMVAANPTMRAALDRMSQTDMEAAVKTWTEARETLEPQVREGINRFERAMRPE